MASGSHTKAAIDLWNDDVQPQEYGTREQYFEHIFQQYKIFVEMTDQISARRNLANTFFLTLHTVLLAGAAFLYEKGPRTTTLWLNIFPLIAVLALCYVWWRLIESYRQLNEGKFLVIGEFERRLPSSPYVRAEWKALGEGKDPKRYRPLTKVENWVPPIFGLLYILMAISLTL